MRACFKSPWKHFYIVPLSPGSTAEYQAPFPNDTAIRWQVRMRHENQGFIEGEVGRNKRYMLRMLWQLYQYVHRIKSTYCVFPIPGSRLTHLCWLVPSSQLEKLRNLLLSKNISNYISKLLVVIFGNIKIDFLSFFFFSCTSSLSTPAFWDWVSWCLHGYAARADPEVLFLLL